MSELKIIKLKYKIICIGVMILCITMVGYTRKKEKTAEDWTQDKVMANVVFAGEDWGNSIVENKKNIFYMRSDGKIVRFDKQNKKKEVIVKLKGNKEDEHIGSLTLHDSRLYYIYDNSLYQSNFNGQHKKLIVYGENIKNVPEEYAKYIYGVHMEHEQMYLLLQGMISDNDSVIYSFYSKEKPILKIYDIKTKQEKEMKLPSDFSCIIQVVDGHLLYQTIKAGEIRDTYSKIKLR